MNKANDFFIKKSKILYAKNWSKKLIHRRKPVFDSYFWYSVNFDCLPLIQSIYLICYTHLFGHNRIWVQSWHIHAPNFAQLNARFPRWTFGKIAMVHNGGHEEWFKGDKHFTFGFSRKNATQWADVQRDLIELFAGGQVVDIERILNVIG